MYMKYMTKKVAVDT